MTKALLGGDDRSPSLWASTPADRDTDQFSILDGLSERSRAGDRATRWTRALQFGVPGLALAVATGAVFMRSVDGDTATARAAPSLSAKTQDADAPRALLPATAGAGSAQGPEQGGVARIIMATPGQGRAAADGTVGTAATAEGVDPARPRLAPARAALTARADPQHTDRQVARPVRAPGSPPRDKRGRDRDVDIITAIVENAGQTR